MAEKHWSDLAAIKPHGQLVTSISLSVHTLAFAKLGHDLNTYADEVWRKLITRSRGTNRSTIVLTCMRCMVPGMLEEWNLMLSGCCGEWPAYCAGQPADMQRRFEAMEGRCDLVDVTWVLELSRVLGGS